MRKGSQESRVPEIKQESSGQTFKPLNPRTLEAFELKMIIGTGIDIVNIERIERLMTRWGGVFLGRVFTETEIDSCQQKARPPECFAIRFAAKEAFLKAIGWGLRNGIQWTDIEVKNDAMGKPLFSFHRKAKEVCQALRVQNIFLTLSHDQPYAVAHVLLEEGSNESSQR